MDERERNAEDVKKAGKPSSQKRRPGSSDKKSDSVCAANNSNTLPGTRSRSDHGEVRRRRARRKSSRAKRRRKNLVIRAAIMIALPVIAAAGFLFWRKYSSSNEKADLIKYYGVQSNNDLAVVVDTELVKSSDKGQPVGRLIDGVPYIEYSVVYKHINERFYWDSNENILLYTLPDGSVSAKVGSKEYTDIKDKKSEDYVILKTEGKTAFIALPFIQKYTNMEYGLYEEPVKRVVIDSKWGESYVSEFKRDTQVRYQGGVKSPILSEVKKSQSVTVLGDEGDWIKVRTKDGFIGYVKSNTLKKAEKDNKIRSFKEPEYKNISLNKPVNMVWHNVENDTANNFVLEAIASTKGLTTIAPTWFSIADTKGNLASLANAEYVNFAHQSNIDVWAVLRDFHGGINSYDETLEVLSYTSKREALINQVIGAALQAGIDGINLDFELISAEAGQHYIQFIRELSVKCRQNGLVLSVANYVPMPYNEHYNLKEQGIVADYVIIMGYDEYTDNSFEAGPVASYDYVKDGIENALKLVPNNKLINAIPFYTRLWKEQAKTPEELAEQAGTEAGSYSNKVSSTAMGMDEAQQTLQEAGAETQWDGRTKQNYAQWDTDDATYKMWVEDKASIEEKLKLIKSNDLAGVAAWRLGLENSGIWDVILQYVN